MKTRTLFHRIMTRFMRVFFYLLYQPMAWSYDLVAATVSWGRWKDWVMTVLPYLNGPGILEIGYGPGHLQVALHRKDLLIFGIDASHQMGLQARKRILKRRYTPHLARGYAQRLPYPDRVFDQIVTTFPSEYVCARETLQEAYRTLKPGGTLLVLPAAWITGKRLVDRSTSALFRVTGQSQDWDPQWLAPFSMTGFQAEVEMITKESWSLAIILAHKPG
jgi:ubiquinone/menaquinone biosynthesis C-methylase UbiE